MTQVIELLYYMPQQLHKHRQSEKKIMMACLITDAICPSAIFREALGEHIGGLIRESQKTIRLI